MAIIVSKDGKNARRMEPKTIAEEDYLQAYIHQNPEAIPVTELKEGAKLLILAREFPTASGPIDALGVDSDGDIYIIETKLYKNPDKRLVIAQMLDYGAALWKENFDFAEFMAEVERAGGDKITAGLARTLADCFKLDDEGLARVLEQMRTVVANGQFQFIVLMNRLEERLKTLISFVNANSRFRVLGCELEFYEHDGYEILIPKLYGAEVKTPTAGSGSRSPTPYVSYEEKLQELPDPKIRDLVLRLLKSTGIKIPKAAGRMKCFAIVPGYAYFSFDPEGSICAATYSRTEKPENPYRIVAVEVKKELESRLVALGFRKVKSRDGYNEYMVYDMKAAMPEEETSRLMDLLRDFNKAWNEE